MVAIHLPQSKPIIKWIVIAVAIFGLFAAANGIGSIVAGKTVVQVGGKGKAVVIARDSTYDVGALCTAKEATVTYGLVTDITSKEYVVSNGLDQVRWKSTPGNLVAMHYWIKDGVQQSEPVEITKSFVNCALAKAK